MKVWAVLVDTIREKRKKLKKLERTSLLVDQALNLGSLKLLVEGKRVAKRKSKNWQTNLKFFSLFIGGLVLISLFLKIGQTIKNSIFDGQNRITLVLAPPSAGENILVFSLEPKSQSLSLLIIPANTQVLVSKNYGTYQLGNVYRLGSLSSSQAGGELLRETAQDFVGVPVDGWAMTNLKADNSNIRSMVKDSLSVRSAVGFIKSGGLTNVETNLTILDMLRIWWEARNIGIDRIGVSNLAKTKGVKKTQLLDETEVYEANTLLLDEISADLFVDSQALKERKTVEIINGTRRAGLGSQVARITSNMGAQVLFVKSSQEIIKKSNITIVNEGSYTARKISKALGIPIIKSKEQNKEADILILIGEDY